MSILRYCIQHIKCKRSPQPTRREDIDRRVNNKHLSILKVGTFQYDKTNLDK